jgi:protein tyrosine phosphatase
MASSSSLSCTPPPNLPVEFTTDGAALLARTQILEQTLQTYHTPQFRETLFAELSQATKALKFEYLKSQRDTARPEVYARFSDLPCPKETAVKVGDRYLHANYVSDTDGKRVFVASQLPHDCYLELFWKFIFDEQRDIMDLFHQESSYYPTSENRLLNFNSIQVEYTETFGQTRTEYFHSYIVRDRSTQQQVYITRFHFTGWQTHAVVDVPTLDSLVQKLETSSLVHCLAGHGRTGTVIAAYLIKQRLLQNPDIDLADLGYILVELILHLREQRGPHFVESDKQFFLLLDYAIFLFRQIHNC